MKHLIKWILIGFFYFFCFFPPLLIGAIAALVYWSVEYFSIAYKVEKAINDFFDIE